MKNQVLLHSLSKVIQGTSKNCFRMKLVVVVIASFEFLGCDGLSGVFPTIFVLQSNDLRSESLSSTSVVIPQAS